MVRRRFDVEVPDGQHLGFSRDTDGAYRGHLFDDATNRLVGHADLLEPDDDEWDSDAYPSGSGSPDPEVRELTPEEIAQALEALAALVLVIAALASAAAPHVRRWWAGAAISARAAGAKGRSVARASRDHVVDAARTTWGKVARARRAGRAGSSELVTTDESGRPAAASTELQVAFHDYRARMSSTEARERFVAALLAKAFSDEQMRLLRNVTIEDDGGTVAIGDALRPPTPQQIAETVRLTLERNPSLLDEDSLASLAELLGRGQPDREDLSLRVRRLGAPPRHPDRPLRDREPEAD